MINNDYHDYRSYSADNTSESSEDETAYFELAARPVQKNLAQWVDEHYDVLTELFSHFKTHGTHIFGSCFYQFGTFADFVRFLFDTTVLQTTNLLKSSVTDVSSVGVSTWRKHGVYGIQTTGNERSPD